MNALTDLPAPAALAATFSDRLPAPVRDESQQVARLLAELNGRLDWAAVIALGTPWVDAVRRHPARALAAPARAGGAHRTHGAGAHGGSAGGQPQTG